VADRNALADAQKAGLTLLSRKASTSQRAVALRHTLADSRSAESLHPGDEAPLTIRVYAYAFAGKGRQALRAAQRLTHAEPRNRIGWTAIQDLAQYANPRLAAQARARLRELVRDPSRPNRR